jgi:hypothetical protein
MCEHCQGKKKPNHFLQDSCTVKANRVAHFQGFIGVFKHHRRLRPPKFDRVGIHLSFGSIFT